MIAKSILSALLVSFGIATIARSPYETNYFNILKEYEITPPSLKYGYPLWYQYDSLPVTGIIFLKNDLDELHKINDITYVAEPTQENAEIIFNFSGMVGAHPKFYIIPDSGLTWKQVLEFMEILVPDYWQTNFLLCGGKGKYFNFSIVDESYRYGSPVCNGYHDILSIINNCQGQVLAEGEFAVPDSINQIVVEFYWGNYGNRNYDDYNFRAMERLVIDTASCLRLMEQYNDQITILGNENLDGIELYRSALSEQTGLLNYARKWKRLLIPRGNARVKFNFQYCERGIAELFDFVDQINKGVYLSREKKALEFSTLSYMDMVRLEKVEYLQYIHLEFPDLIQHYFERFPHMPLFW